MAFTPYYPGGWQSGEEGGTPITPDVLNHYDDAFDDVYDAIQQTTAVSSETDFSNVLDPGLHICTITTNRPVSNTGAYAAIVITRDTGVTTQIAIPTGSNAPNGIYVRNRNGAGVWTGWYKFTGTAV